MDNEIRQKHTPEETSKILETSMLAGTILLQNGAELFRVEETMERISSFYGEKTGDYFVLSNGIFVTGSESGGGSFAKVRHIPIKGVQLQKISAVNQLSREIVSGKYNVDEAYEQLQEIQKLKGEKYILQVLAAGVACAGFSWMFGGSFRDGVASLISGLVLQAFVLYVYIPYLSKILGNLLGGVLATVLCLLCYELGIGNQMKYILTGTMMLLVPGVAFTNGIRDLVFGDYISGTVRLLDALVVFVSAAAGMAMTLMAYTSIFGGGLL